MASRIYSVSCDFSILFGKSDGTFQAAIVSVSNQVKPREDCDILSSTKGKNVRLSILNIRRSI